MQTPEKIKGDKTNGKAAQGKITQVQLARFLRCDVVTARQIVTECLTSSDVAADGRLEMLHLEEFQKSLLSSAS